MDMKMKFQKKTRRLLRKVVYHYAWETDSDDQASPPEQDSDYESSDESRSDSRSSGDSTTE